MTRAILAALILVGTTLVAERREPPPADADLVELDVVAIDRDGQPVRYLQPQDFRVREEGKAVDITTFAEVSADGLATDRARSMVLLLDDSGVPPGGTSVVQAMAGRILTRMRPRDEVTVVRLNNDHDEPFGDEETARRRIADYRGGAVPFQVVGTGDRMLNVLASIARQLESVEHRRKLIVCVGSPGVCNMGEPQPRGYNQLWTPWVAAMTTTARANASVYSVMPTHPGGVLMIGGGLADLTGGTGFSNTGSFDAFISELWAEASHYYLLGYWPPTSRHELRSIDVKVSRKGVSVRTHRQR